MLRNFDNFDDFNLPTRTWGTNNNGVDAKNVKLNNTGQSKGCLDI